MYQKPNPIVDLLAEILARFIVGAGTALFVLFLFMRWFPVDLFENWKVLGLIACGVGAVAGIFGLRKGPGVI